MSRGSTRRTVAHCDFYQRSTARSQRSATCRGITRRKLRSATKYGTKDKLLKNVTKDAIEKAGKTGDLDAKCQAVANAAALEDVEQQRRDAAAAGKTLSTADAEGHATSDASRFRGLS